MSAPRCPEPGCVVRWHGGSDRPCLQHLERGLAEPHGVEVREGGARTFQVTATGKARRLGPVKGAAQGGPSDAA